MDQEQEKRKLEDKLAKCRRLAREYNDGVTNKNLLDLIAELEEQARDLDENEAAGLL